MTLNQNTEITIGVDNAIIDVDENSSFTANPGFTLNGSSITATNNGLIVRKNDNHLDLMGAKFTAVSFEHYGSILNIGEININDHSNFKDCPWIGSNRGMVTIKYSTFDHSPLSLYECDLSLSEQVTVDYCIFTGSNTAIGCQIGDYKKYSITNNIINGGSYGLYLSYIGSTSGDHLIRNNYITGCNVAGLCIYGSAASIEMNHISSCNMGIEILDNSSNVSMVGYQLAFNYANTQEIKDCSGLEIYATNNCLPYYMKYNAIIDEDRTPPDPLLYYDNLRTGVFPKYDVSYNCWDNSFDLSNDLKLNYGIFKPYPTWCLTNIGITPNPEEEMYRTAVNYVDSSNYTEAMNLFRLLIETYPKSDYAKASMKAMLEIEPYAGNNFSSLRLYYLTNDSIIADTALANLGDFLANSCNVQIGDYPEAISWYENKIQNSTDPTDSVFAIIDLGHLYLMMDTTGDAPVYIGSLPQYRPKTMAKYVIYRDSLISLLPFSKDPLKRSITKLQNGQLLQNVPNPTSSSTDFYFKLFGAANADIKIYDSWGRLKQVIPITTLSNGTQRITFNTSNLPSGIYEYVLTINGKRTDAKKMVVN